LDDLSLHILDIMENSVTAGAKMIGLEVSEETGKNRLTIQIKDDGKGMDKETLTKVLDPFYTKKTVRRVGLGLSMLAQAAKEAGGSLEIDSELGKGTKISAIFVYDHIDRKPLGNMAETISAFIVGSGTDVDLTYRHRKNGNEFVFSSTEVKKILEGVAINNPEVIAFLKDYIQGGLNEISERSRK
jgi:anti-sigma regulatory factor (Ser/Thr protein kinase)